MARQRLEDSLTRATFVAHLVDAAAVSFDGVTFVVCAVDAPSREWLEHRLDVVVRRTLAVVVGHPVEVRYVVRAAAREAQL